LGTVTADFKGGYKVETFNLLRIIPFS